MLRRPTTALVALIPLAAACSTVATVRHPAQFISSKTPRVVWITSTDNSSVALLSPRVRADTLAGLADGVHYVEMPLSNVRSMRARQPAPRRTLLLVGGLALGVAALARDLGRGAGSSPVVCLDPADQLLCKTGASQYPP